MPDAAGSAARGSETASPQADARAAFSRPDLARSLAGQIAHAVQASAGGPIEIQLAPEELGRVRLSIDARDTAVIVTIAADRPETTDLMRRNIELLARDFRDQGYVSVSFAFEHRQDSRGDRPGEGPDPRSEANAAPLLPIPSPQPVSVRSVPADRLDLRL